MNGDNIWLELCSVRNLLVLITGTIAFTAQYNRAG